MTMIPSRITDAGRINAIIRWARESRTCAVWAYVLKSRKAIDQAMKEERTGRSYMGV